MPGQTILFFLFFFFSFLWFCFEISVCRRPHPALKKTVQEGSFQSHSRCCHFQNKKDHLSHGMCGVPVCSEQTEIFWVMSCPSSDIYLSGSFFFCIVSVSVCTKTKILSLLCPDIEFSIALLARPIVCLPGWSKVGRDKRNNQKLFKKSPCFVFD